MRDRCLVLLTFRHGLRVSEACRLQLDQVDTDSRVMHVRRLKHGLSTDHPLRTDELRAIGAWLKERGRMKVPAGVASFFVSGRRQPLHRSSVNLLLQKYSDTASLPLRASRTSSASVFGSSENVSTYCIAATEEKDTELKHSISW